MIEWPENLVSDIARRRAVIVLGSGISRNSKNDSGKSPKTWGEFLKAQGSAMSLQPEYKQTLDRFDYLTACELLKQKLGQDSFRTLLIKEFLSPRYHHSIYHEMIFKLDARIVVTPNFDKIYETYANTQAQSSIRVKQHYDPDFADAIRRNERIILKMHGTIDTPDQMIFTRREYAEARTKHRHFYKLLEALALTNTFVFLGCGLHDPDTRLMLEDIFFRHEINQPHVFVMPEKTMSVAETKIVEETMNLSCLEYSLGPSSEHDELLASLKDLLTQVDVTRNQLTTTRNW